MSILLPMAVGILGAGSWGTALAVMLARNGHDVVLAGRDAEEIESIRARRENMRYLPGFAVPVNVTPTLLPELPQDLDTYIIAIPSAGVNDSLRFLPDTVVPVVLASKGLCPHTGKPLSELISERKPNAERVSLGGPNLAVELLRGVPSVAVSASHDEAVAETVARLFNCATFRVYLSDDLTGVELAGALKNILAISAGISDGLGFGDNTKAALLARGLYEMVKLGVKMGGRMETFFGIAGAGDLVATASSTLSRNYRLGFSLGKGSQLESAQFELGQVAEGVPTAIAAVNKARELNVEVPIMAGTEAVIAGRLSPRDAVTMLMDKMPRHEGLGEFISTYLRP